MSFLPHVVRAEYRGEFRIHLVFNDGSAGVVDFEPWFEGPVFEPFAHVHYFKRFFVDGGGVSWPNGADIAPEALYAAVLADQSRATA
jgi:hypothetical protein